MEQLDPLTFRTVAPAPSPRRWTVGSVSALTHALVLLLLVGVVHRPHAVVPYKLPGTSQGVEFLTYYSGGSATKTPDTVTPKKSANQAEKTTVHDLSVAKRPQPQTASPENGPGTMALSGQGDGDIAIALETYFPHPQPDLSSLPHGTKGDVVLDGVVDEQGRVTELTLMQGLGPAIDDTVIATVKQWTFTPARKGGLPVPSKREFHFHYERG